MLETVCSVRPVAVAMAGRAIGPPAPDDLEDGDLVVVLDPGKVGPPAARDSPSQRHAADRSAEVK